MPDDYRPAAAPDAGGPNPHFRGAQADVAVFDGRPLLLASAAPDAGLAAAAAWAGHFRGAAADALEWLWGVLLGDFAEDPSTGQVITGAVVTMVPVVDQIADVRDVVANLRHLFDDERRADPWTWVALAITLVGVVPVFGSAAKGALRLVAKGLREGGSTTRRAVFAVIRKLGHGDPERFAARHLSAAAMRGAARAQLGRVLGLLRGFFGAAARSRWAPESVRAAAGRALGRLGAVEREAPARLDEAVAALDRGVQRALREGDSDLAARGTTNGRVRAEAETADPPGDGAGPTESSAGGHAGRAALPEGAEWGRLGPRLEKRTLEAPGWPDLPATQAENFTDARAVELREGEKIYRVIDNPGGGGRQLLESRAAAVAARVALGVRGARGLEPERPVRRVHGAAQPGRPRVGGRHGEPAGRGRHRPGRGAGPAPRRRPADLDAARHRDPVGAETDRVVAPPHRPPRRHP